MFKVEQFQLPYPVKKVHNRIREEFMKNSHVRDVRAIDLLVIKVKILHYRRN